MRKNRRGFLPPVMIFAILVALALIGFIVWYSVFYSNESDNDLATAEETTVNKLVFSSELYPAVKFALVEGWEVVEPSTYMNGVGLVDASIVLSADDFELTLPFVAARPTSYESLRCYRDSDLKLFDVRENSTDLVRYQHGGQYYYDFAYTANYEEFEAMSTPSDFTEVFDADPNYCTTEGPLILAGINSTVKATVAEQGIDQDEDGHINAWLMRPNSNTDNISKAKRAEMDIMLLQLYSNLKDKYE